MANYSPLAAIFNHPNVIQNFMTDVISTQNSLLWWLHGKPVNTGGGLKPTAKKFIREQDGGSRFEVPLMLVTNPNAKAYAKDDTFDVTANDLGDRAYFDIKSIGTTIPIYGYDIDVSDSSNSAIKNIQKNFLEQASISVLNLLISQMYASDGTEGANDWNSILTLIAQDPTADSIGGISSATYTKWANYYKSESGVSLASYIVKELTTMMTSTTYGINRPKLIVTTPTIWGALFAVEQGNQRFMPDAELAKIGFQALNFMGVPVFFDAALPSGNVLGINADALEYGILKGANMKMLPPVRPHNADMEVSFLKHRGNFLIRDRRSNGRLFTFTTA